MIINKNFKCKKFGKNISVSCKIYISRKINNVNIAELLLQVLEIC